MWELRRVVWDCAMTLSTSVNKLRSARDTGAVLNEFIPYFGAQITGITGDETDVLALAKVEVS